MYFSIFEKIADNYDRGDSEYILRTANHGEIRMDAGEMAQLRKAILLAIPYSKDEAIEARHKLLTAIPFTDKEKAKYRKMLLEEIPITEEEIMAHVKDKAIKLVEEELA